MKEQTIILAALALLALAAVAPVLSVVVSVPEMQKPEKAETHYYRRNEKAHLQCQASGDSEYKWIKDGIPVDTSDSSTPISFDSQTGNLTIPSYSASHNGEYYCLATIGRASSMSQTQTLVEIEDRNGFKLEPTVNEVITKYSYFFKHCTGQNKIVVAPGTLSYNWYIGSTKKSQIDLDDGRLFISKNGSLYFTYVKESDAHNQELYQCGYSGKGSTIIAMGSFLTIQVKDATASGTPARLQYNTGRSEVQVGNDAKLECFFSGYSDSSANHLPTITWYDEKGTLITNTDKFAISKDGRVLTVKDLEPTDAQTFSCEGWTPMGNTDRVYNELVVTSIPRWKTVGPMKKTKPEDSNAVFICDAESLQKQPKPDPPVWYVNGRAFDGSQSMRKYTFSEENKKLTINKLSKPDDIQCIQCTVKNNIGTLMGDACLNVMKPIVVSRRPPEVQRIKKGDIIDLTVNAVSDPDISSPLTYNWTINNVTYKRSSLGEFMTDNMTNIFINTSDLSTDVYDTLESVIKINVYNQYENKELTTRIELLDFTPPVVDLEATTAEAAPVAASAGFDMWIIGLIIGIVFLIVVVAIIIFVLCRKQQEGDYNVGKKETGAGLDPEKELRDKGFNDLSRPDYDDYDYPEKKPRGDLEYDDVPIGGDDESLGEYGDEEDTHFNEDGSFIGIYQKKENERQGHKTESTI